MLTVFGSLNVDVCVQTSRFPRPGETILGSQALVTAGGKGANQAHAAALYGAPTRLFGMVGDDRFAPVALAGLGASGVDISGVGVAAGQSTGLAMVTVNEAGENSIVVAPGANLLARADQVTDEVLRSSRIVLMQLELPLEECWRLTRRARQHGCKVLLNPSPIPEGFHLEPGCVDTLIMNQGELEQFSAQLCVYGADSMERARHLACALGIEVLVTLGARGSYLARPDGGTTTAQAASIDAVDTTGAGDAYAGVFAAAMALGVSWQSAMQAASIAASLTCTKPGAQVAQPTREDIEAVLAQRGEHLEMFGDTAHH